MRIIIIILAISHLGTTLVPSDTYVTENGGKVMKILREQKQARKILKVSRVFRVPISGLKPYPCDNIEYTAHHLRDFGSVGTIDKTFTEVFTMGGRYYKAPREYDLYCACPPLYSIEWDPALGTQKIYSPQERDSYIAQEIIKITAIRKPAWYLIYFKNKNRMEFPYSGRGIRVGPSDPKVREMQLRPKPLRWGINTLIIKDPVSQIRYEHEVVKVRRHNIETPLRIIDYIIMLMYESYTWVEWKVLAIYANNVDETWRNQTRGDPCNIATEEMWGITYNRSVQWTEEICYPLKYSYMANASDEGFDLILPLGRFEVTNPIVGENYDQRIMNYALNWRFTDAEITKEVLLRLSIRHGALRRMPTMIQAIVPNNLMVRYHKTFFLSPRWSVGRTRMMVQRNEVMCDRDAYTSHIKNSRANLQGGAQQYRILKMLQDREPDVCMTIPHYNGGCPNPTKASECQFAVGDQEKVFQRVGFLLDPWENQAHIPQGEVCFGPNLTKPVIQTEEIFSRNLTLIAIRPTAMLADALAQNLSTFEQWIRTIRNKRYRVMVRRMKRVVDATDAMRRMAGRINDLRLRFARYKDRYMVAQGESRWSRKVSEIREWLGNLQNTFRRNELTMNMLLEQERKAIKAYYLYKRIELMLPHLNVIRLKIGKVYQIKIARGEVIIKELYRYDNGSKQQSLFPGTQPPSSASPTTMVNDVKMSGTGIRDKTTTTQGVTLSTRGKDPIPVKTREITETITLQELSNQHAQRTPEENAVEIIDKVKSKGNQIPQIKTLPMNLRTRWPQSGVIPTSETMKVININKGESKSKKIIKVTEDHKLAVKSHKAMKGLGLALTTIGIIVGIILTLGMGWKIRKDIKRLKEKRQLQVARGILKKQRKLNSNLKKRVSFAGNHEHVTTTH